MVSEQKRNTKFQEPLSIKEKEAGEMAQFLEIK